MKDEELNSEVKALAAKWWKEGKISHLWGTDTEVELAAYVRSVAAKARDEALSEAAERECVLCRDGFALHYGDWPLPFHRVSGRVRKCAARLIHALKSGSVEG